MSPYSCSIFLMSPMIAVMIGLANFNLISNCGLHGNHAETKYNQINL